MSHGQRLLGTVWLDLKQKGCDEAESAQDTSASSVAASILGGRG